MTYRTVNGKLVRQPKVHKREPSREPIETKYQHELWHTGPVNKVAKMLAKEDLRKKLIAEGRDLRYLSEREIDNGVTVLLFNSGAYYLNKAKEWLR